jgi:hypothetical protein
MNPPFSKERQTLWNCFRICEKVLRTLQRSEPMAPGSLYRLQRQCGKSPCRCQRGHLHATWVLTRSEAGQRRLYAVPAAQRGRLRRLCAEYRRWQRARARLVKLTSQLLRQVDALAEHRLVAWPQPSESSDPATARTP